MTKKQPGGNKDFTNPGPSQAAARAVSKQLAGAVPALSIAVRAARTRTGRYTGPKVHVFEAAPPGHARPGSWELAQQHVDRSTNGQLDRLSIHSDTSRS